MRRWRNSPERRVFPVLGLVLACLVAAIAWAQSVTGVPSSSSAGGSSIATTAHATAVGAGGSAFHFVAPGTSGMVLTSNGPFGDPTYQFQSGHFISAAFFCQVTTGSPTNYACSSGYTTISQNDLVLVQFDVANTGSAIFSPQGGLITPALIKKKQGSAVLSAGDIQPGLRLAGLRRQPLQLLAND